MNRKYQIGTKENKEFLQEQREQLLSFGHQFPSPEGSSYWLGDDGMPWKDRNRETWITARMAHVYSLGTLLGHKGSEELADNIFRIAQTDAKLKRDNVDNEYTANSVHYEIGKIVRKAIKEAGGTMPEDLPTPNKSLKELEKENKNNIKLQNVCKDLEKYT